MSRTSFNRSDRALPAALAATSFLDLADAENGDFHVERDELLEGDFLETSLEDYDDLLSIAGDDDFEL